MAKLQKDLKGWEIVFEDNKSLRNKRGSSISVRRVHDNLEINEGDCISFSLRSTTDSPIVGLGFIKDIKFGTDAYLVIKFLWFVKYNENLNKYLPKLPNGDNYTNNDLFLTPFMDSVNLNQIIKKHNLVSINELKSLFETSDLIDKDEQIFVCRRFTDDTTTYFTDLIDWGTMYELFKENKDEFFDTLKLLTLKPSSKNNSPVKIKQSKSGSVSVENSPLKNKRRKIEQVTTIDLSDHEKQKSVNKVARKLKLEDSIEEITEDKIEINDNSSLSEYNSEEEEEEEEVEEDTEDDSLDDFIVNNELDDLDYYEKNNKKRTSSPTKAKYKTGSSPTKRKLKEKLIPELPSIDKDLEFLAGNAFPTTKLLNKAKKILGTGTQLKSLPCREEEFYQIYHNLEISINSQKGSCIYVSGTPGVGKTATIREVIKQLSAKMTIESDGIKRFNYLEINGLKIIKPQQAYEILWQKIAGTKASTTTSLTYLQQHFENDLPDLTKKELDDKLPLVVLLDELDQIVTKNQAVMYNFFNWPTYENSKLIVIAVANTMDLPERLLTNKISSRLGLSRIQFTSYSYTQLSEIIKHRLEQLSKTDNHLLIAKDAIEFASRKVASVSGDARRSLMICIRAVEIAQAEFLSKNETERKTMDGKYTVTIMHIMKAINEASSSPVNGYLNSLSFLSKLVLSSILLRKKRSGIAEIEVGEIYDELNNQIQILLFTELKNKLSLDNLQLLDIVFGSGDQRMQGSVINSSLFILKDLEENGVLMMQPLKIERNRLIRLNISDDEIVNSLKKDPLMKEIITFI